LSRAFVRQHWRKAVRLRSTPRIGELSRAGKYAEAIPLVQQLVANLEKSSSPNNRDLGASLSNLALLYGNQGRDAEAAPPMPCRWCSGRLSVAVPQPRAALPC
jgi:hypothetical protein